MPRAKAGRKAREIAWWRTGGRCACGCGELAQQPHHIFAVQRWPHLANEPDNVVAVAWHCHANHEARHKLFTRKVARHAERLATTEAMHAYLEKFYPLKATKKGRS